MAHYLVYARATDSHPSACADADTHERVQSLPGDQVVMLIRGTCPACNRHVGYTPTETTPPFKGHVRVEGIDPRELQF